MTLSMQQTRILDNGFLFSMEACILQRPDGRRMCVWLCMADGQAGIAESLNDARSIAFSKAGWEERETHAND